jgi:uncharacterized protein YndB with AHSA1/START domain
MLKWILIAVAALALVVVAVAVVGALLPTAHVAARAARFRQPPEAVFARISDVGLAASWRTDITRVEMLPSVEGRVRFREIGRMGGVTMEVVERTAPTRMVTRIADPEQPFGGTWTFELAPADGGTRLTITERGEVYNPIFRALGRFVFGHTATIDQYLRALGAAFGDAVTPEGA